MTNYTDNEKMEIAQTIINQMGAAGRLKAMIGAKNFLAPDAGVQFDFKMNPRMNRVKISLNSMDLYDVEFYHNIKITGNEISIEEIDRKVAKSKIVVASFEGVYNDQLKPIFEETTGLYLSL